MDFPCSNDVKVYCHWRYSIGLTVLDVMPGWCCKVPDVQCGILGNVVTWSLYEENIILVALLFIENYFLLNIFSKMIRIYTTVQKFGVT